MSSSRWHTFTLAGYFGLFALLMAWIGWIAPPEKLPRSIALVAAVGPLLFPLRGLLHARPYTHAWSSFLALFYFAYGTAEAFTGSPVRLLAISESVLSLLWFVSAVMFARTRGRESRS